MLDMEARYSVRQYPGVAFYLLGYVVERVWAEPAQICYPEDGHDHDGDCFAYPEEPEEVLNEDRVRAVMVGDDTVYEVDKEDLTPVDNYCGGCGQIGCGW